MESTKAAPKIRKPETSSYNFYRSVFETGLFIKIAGSVKNYRQREEITGSVKVITVKSNRERENFIRKMELNSIKKIYTRR